MTNLARFTIDGTPSSQQGFDVSVGATPSLQLEVSSEDVRLVTFQVHDASELTSPRCSKSAPALTLDNGHGQTGWNVNAFTPATAVTISAGVPATVHPHIWEIRCLVNGGTNQNGTPNPDLVFSRFVAMRSAQGLRKLLFSERNEYDPIDAWTGAINEIIEIWNAAGGSLSLDWSSITGKPVTFPPSSHNQDWSTITGKPTEFTPAAHNQDWTTITGKPSTFTPSAHNQDWSTITGKPTTLDGYGITDGVTDTELANALSSLTLPWSSITGKPATFPPAAHNQDWTTITGKPTTFSPSAHAASHAPGGSDAIATGSTANTVCVGNDPRLSDARPPLGHTQDWSTITGKPTEFTPAAHNQDWSTITGKPATFTPSAHNQDWSTITGKPTEFTPAAHNQDWTTITGKPTTFTPSAHAASHVGGADAIAEASTTTAGLQSAAQKRNVDALSHALLQAYGGKDDWVGPDDGIGSATNNSVALSALIAANPNGCIIDLPKTNTGVYYFSGINNGVLNGYTLNPEPGVTLRLADLAAQPDARCTRPTKFYLESLKVTQWFSHRIGGYELEQSTVVHPALHQAVTETVTLTTEARLVEMPWPDGPFVDTGVPTETFRCQLQPTVSASAFRFCLVPVAYGEEINACYRSDSTFGGGFLGFCVLLANGHYVAYQKPGGDQPSILRKVGADAATSTPFDYKSRTTHSSYWPEKSLCTIRVHSRRSFSVLYNGVEVHFVEDTGSDIVEVGFGGGYNSSASSIWVTHWTRARKKITSGKRPLKIAVVGDSITDISVQGSWTYAMLEALEGASGVRVDAFGSYAVSGESSAQQLARLQAADTGGQLNAFNGGILCIQIGVNDIQGGVSVDSYVTNLAAMITIGQAHGMTVVAGVPTMYYTRGQSVPFGGLGQASQNYDAGSLHRTAAMYQFAAMGVHVVHGALEDLGPVVAEYLQTTKDPIMRDNIHPTAFGYRQLGYAYARTILGALQPAADVVSGTPASGKIAGCDNRGNPRWESASDLGLLQNGDERFNVEDGLTLATTGYLDVSGGTLGYASNSAGAGHDLNLRAQSSNSDSGGSVNIYAGSHGTTGATGDIALHTGNSDTGKITLRASALITRSGVIDTAAPTGVEVDLQRKSTTTTGNAQATVWFTGLTTAAANTINNNTTYTLEYTITTTGTRVTTTAKHVATWKKSSSVLTRVGDHTLLNPGGLAIETSSPAENAIALLVTPPGGSGSDVTKIAVNLQIVAVEH